VRSKPARDRRFKHESDIRDILIAVKLEDDPDLSAAFDPAYIDRWATRLGPEVEAFWQTRQRLINPDQT
jgi:hypothetical protein